MNSNTDDEALNALTDLQQGIDSAKQLVARTRSLLNGETAYDPDELAMIAAAAGPQAAAPEISEIVQNPDAE